VTHRFEGDVDLRRTADAASRSVSRRCTPPARFTGNGDIASERLLAAVDVPGACGQAPMVPKVNVPTWVTGTVSGLK
jgi:hypothetical protein